MEVAGNLRAVKKFLVILRNELDPLRMFPKTNIRTTIVERVPDHQAIASAAPAVSFN
jgi:hypothetical protein